MNNLFFFSPTIPEEVQKIMLSLDSYPKNFSYFSGIFNVSLESGIFIDILRMSKWFQSSKIKDGLLKQVTTD